MKKLLILSLPFLLVACAKEEAIHVGDPELKPYTERFYKLSLDLGRPANMNVRINFVNDLSGHVIGRCIMSLGGNFVPIIEISKKDWDGYSEGSREELVFHELAHCVLGRGHKNQDSHSLMYPYHRQFEYTEDGGPFGYHWKENDRIKNQYSYSETIKELFLGHWNFGLTDGNLWSLELPKYYYKKTVNTESTQRASKLSVQPLNLEELTEEFGDDIVVFESVLTESGGIKRVGCHK